MKKCILPLGPNVSIVKSDPLGLYALNKPCGVKSHPNEHLRADFKALFTVPYDRERECYLSENGPVYLLHRLDSPTSGIILVSTDADVTQAIRLAFENDLVVKHYRAIVCGLLPRSGTFAHKMQTLQRQGKLRAQVAHGGREAKTSFKTLRTFRLGRHVFSYIELTPHTGRTHQLRVQCAAAGHPILGDDTYGHFSTNKTIQSLLGHTRLYLHAANVEVTFTLRGRTHTFTANCPVEDTWPDAKHLN